MGPFFDREGETLSEQEREIVESCKAVRRRASALGQTSDDQRPSAESGTPSEPRVQVSATVLVSLWGFKPGTECTIKYRNHATWIIARSPTNRGPNRVPSHKLAGRLCGT